MRRYLIFIALVLFLLLLAVSSVSAADTISLKNGTRLEGTIQKIENGKIFVDVANETKTVKLEDINAVAFDVNVQALAQTMRELDKSAKEIREKLSQVEAYWLAKQPINASEEAAWLAAKESFEKPLMAYQEVLNDMYFRLLVRVDEYNNMMKEAGNVYVGIKGIRIGSSLIPEGLEELPLRKYVPGSWYDTIFQKGYDLGYSDAMSHMVNPASKVRN